jgi:3-isopropylmalate/(R)-2-methylmalate dehydratase small subunit
VWAIQDWGFEAVIAPSFGDIFRNNSYNVGLLTVELPEDDVARLIEFAENPTAEVKVDLETQVVEVDDFVFDFDIEPGVKERLLKGLDPIGVTLKDEDAISQFEARRPAWLSRRSDQ